MSDCSKRGRGQTSSDYDHDDNTDSHDELLPQIPADMDRTPLPLPDQENEKLSENVETLFLINTFLIPTIYCLTRAFLCLIPLPHPRLLPTPEVAVIGISIVHTILTLLTLSGTNDDTFKNQLFRHPETFFYCARSTAVGLVCSHVCTMFAVVFCPSGLATGLFYCTMALGGVGFVLKGVEWVLRK